MSIDDMSRTFDLPTELVTTILAFIEKHPDWDDEQIASEICEYDYDF